MAERSLDVGEDGGRVVRAPRFWYKGGVASIALAPLGALWAVGAAIRATRPGQHADLPVVCVGNIVAGGAGKTPVAISLARHLPGSQFLTRGYGGREAGPIQVDLERHGHRQVGDEPLLLASVAPCWVARDRLAGARAAAEDGATCVIMDDGYQDPSLIKLVSLLVVDGHVGFGNGRCIPAGPLREPIDRGLERAQAVVLLGEDRAGVTAKLGSIVVLRARLEPEIDPGALRDRRVVAFAGIGRPTKFFQTLEAKGASLVETFSFPDHHPYAPRDIQRLLAEARTYDAALMTTTKDLVRIPPAYRDRVEVLGVAVVWEDETALKRVLAPVLAPRR